MYLINTANSSTSDAEYPPESRQDLVTPVKHLRAVDDLSRVHVGLQHDVQDVEVLRERRVVHEVDESHGLRGIPVVFVPAEVVDVPSAAPSVLMPRPRRPHPHRVRRRGRRTPQTQHDGPCQFLQEVIF